MTQNQNDKPFYLNPDFLKSPDARSIRIATEYLGPKRRFSRNHIEDTIVFFGSARLKSTKVAKTELKNAAKNINPQKKKQLEQNLAMSRFYKDARSLAKRLTVWSKKIKNSKHKSREVQKKSYCFYAAELKHCPKSIFHGKQGGP